MSRVHSHISYDGYDNFLQYLFHPKKLRSVYEKDQQSHKFLEDLIALNVDKDNNRVGDALLWLSRSLQLICTFFENICQDKECLQTLKLQLKDAYERTLKPYHGLILQNTIKVNKWNILSIICK